VDAHHSRGAAASFLGIFLTFSLPLALLGIALAADTTTTSPLAWGLFSGGVAARIALHFVHRIKAARSVLSEIWLLPFCDILILWVWLRSLFTSRIAGATTSSTSMRTESCIRCDDGRPADVTHEGLDLRRRPDRPRFADRHRRAFQLAGHGAGAASRGAGPALGHPVSRLFLSLVRGRLAGAVAPLRGRAPCGPRIFLWATAVRDAVDRLLPVASVGGSLVGVRILRWRGIPGAPAAASVIIEIFLTLIVVYLFTAIGLMLLAEYGTHSDEFRRVLTVFLLSLPIPVVMLMLLRNGAVLERLKAFMHALAGENAVSRGTASLDEEIRASLHRPRDCWSRGPFSWWHSFPVPLKSGSHCGCSSIPSASTRRWSSRA